MGFAVETQLYKHFIVILGFLRFFEVFSVFFKFLWIYEFYRVFEVFIGNLRRNHWAEFIRVWTEKLRKIFQLLLVKKSGVLCGFPDPEWKRSWGEGSAERDGKRRKRRAENRIARIFLKINLLFLLILKLMTKFAKTVFFAKNSIFSFSS